MKPKRATILVIDDEQDMGEMLAFDLAADEFHVLTATSGRAALELLGKHQVDLAICDLMMPEMDGTTTLAALKRLDPALEVIIATGYATVDTAIACMKLGAYDYIRKPYNLSELRHILTQALLKRSLQGTVALYEASQKLMTLLGCSDLREGILELGKHVLRADAVALVVQNAEETTYHCSAASLYLPEETLAHLAAQSQPMGGGESGPGKPVQEAAAILIYPLTVQDRSLGTLLFFRHPAQPDFTMDDRQRGTTFASQVAIALDNARLYAALETAHQELEQRVHERTAALQQVNATLQAEIQERLHIQEDLSLAKEAAETANRTKSQFLATMSHEIRTPLHGIQGMAQLLALTPLNDKQKRYVAMLQRSHTILLDLINDILDFSKIEAGKLELENVVMDIRELSNELLEFFRKEAEAKHLHLRFLLPQTSIPLVSGDPVRLRQILMNLLSNALKFTTVGEVTLHLTIIQEEAAKMLVCFAVHDTGIGIDPQHQQRIFEAFTQADGSTTRAYGGTGLGLAIVKQLVEKMGGSIAVESVVKQGSTFRVTIPFDKQLPLLKSDLMPI